jgi:hypothetical protein
MAPAACGRTEGDRREGPRGRPFWRPPRLHSEAGRTGWGVVVLGGSSGRVEVARARLFAALGAVCIALRWFGGERQPGETWQPGRREGLVTYRSLYERSLQIADNVSAATIPVENARADIILVAGGDDALWPSDMFAKSIEERLASAGKSATLIQHPNAGHRVLFPSETTPRSIRHARGGSDGADAELGRSA